MKRLTFYNSLQSMMKIMFRVETPMMTKVENKRVPLS